MPFHLLDETQVFSGAAAGDRVATLSLVLDEGGQLPMDEVFAKELDHERGEHRRVAELSSFAVSPDFSRPLTEHLVAMTAAAIQFARRQKVDEVLAAVHPRHLRIYRRIMGFEPIGEVAPHGSVLGNPAVPIAAPVNNQNAVHQRFIEQYFGDGFSQEALRRIRMDHDSRRYFNELRQISNGTPNIHAVQRKRHSPGKPR